MNYAFVTLCLFASLSLVYNDSIPFLNVFMKSVNTKTLQTLPFYWGPSGNFEFYQNDASPGDSIIEVTFFANQGSNGFSLNQTQIQSLQSYVQYSKIVEFVKLQFTASQIALSEYDPKYCGLFSDEEYTFDIDMPINPIGKDETSNDRLEFSFEFDLKNEDQMNQIYSFLENVGQKKIKSFIR